jgi:hypothetical protein
MHDPILCTYLSLLIGFGTEIKEAVYLKSIYMRSDI